MNYDYNKLKAASFTDKGQRNLLKVRDAANECFEQAGAFMMFSVLGGIANTAADTWEMMSYVDRLVELGEIREVTGPSVMGQHRVFVKA